VLLVKVRVTKHKNLNELFMNANNMLSLDGIVFFNQCSKSGTSGVGHCATPVLPHFASLILESG